MQGAFFSDLNSIQIHYDKHICSSVSVFNQKIMQFPQKKGESIEMRFTLSKSVEIFPIHLIVTTGQGAFKITY